MNVIGTRLGDERDDVAVTPEKLEAFIEFVNDNSENFSKGRLGKEIEFMERNGIDSYRLLILVRHSAKETGSPVLGVLNAFCGLGDESDERESHFSRALHLQLRDYFRRQFQLPALSAAERRIWPPPIIKPPGFPRPRTTRLGQRITEKVHTLTKEEAARTADYMRRNFPDIVSYYRTVNSLADKQGYVGNDSISRMGLVEQSARASASVLLDKGKIYDVELVKKNLRDCLN